MSTLRPKGGRNRFLWSPTVTGAPPTLGIVWEPAVRLAALLTLAGELSTVYLHNHPLTGLSVSGSTRKLAPTAYNCLDVYPRSSDSRGRKELDQLNTRNGNVACAPLSFSFESTLSTSFDVYSKPGRNLYEDSVCCNPIKPLPPPIPLPPAGAVY
ncbi:hypothetical protein J6590_068460 [Homalodisca vitripennis]|nr:hypothetical protein J6590_068460 [Homalodisca vitripennis]